MEEQKFDLEIVSKIEHLDRKQRVCILRLLTQSTPQVSIVEHSDGCRIRMDLLSMNLKKEILALIDQQLADLDSVFAI